MAFFRVLARAAALAALFPQTVLAHSVEDLAHMGPLGLMWPPDRPWSEKDGRTAPCGTTQGPRNRTDFPLRNGALSLEQKDKAYDVQVSISFSQDPASNDDFTLILPPERVSSLDMAHACFPMPPIPRPAAAGRQATLQLRYVAEYLDPDHHHKRHLPTNETFYACSDITLVEPEAFTFEIPCFNVTASAHGGDDHDHNGDEEIEGAASEETQGSDSSGLSKEAIAGIVIGSVVGAAMIASLGLYLWRRDRREKRMAANNNDGGDDK